MKLEVQVSIKLNIKALKEQVEKATRLGLRDTIVDIWGDIVRLSPAKTGNNRRSIVGEVSTMGKVRGEPPPEGLVDDTKLEAAVYSTSGYGGYLEIGTRAHGPATKPFMVWEDKKGKLIFAKWVRGIEARPYFRPALDMHAGELAPNIKRHLEADHK